jgi:hypothetical protein
MSRDKLIIFGVVLLGLLGVLVYRQVKTDASIGAPQASTTELPTIHAPDDVDKLDIKNGDKPEIVLERVVDSAAPATDGGPAMKWMMTKPLSSEVNQTVVKDLVSNLKDLKVESKINVKVDDDYKKEKQLDAAHGLHLVAYKGGSKQVDETFGKTGQIGTLVTLEDKPGTVWAAKGYSSYLYAKDVKEFRDKSIFKFDDANVTAVDIVNSHGAFTFKRDGEKWVGLQGKKPIERFDPEKVKSLLTTFKGLNADDFADSKSLAEAGLDKPEAQVTFEVKDAPNGPYVLQIGAVSSGSGRYAKRPDRELLYQVTSYVQEWITSDASKYQTTGDAGAPAPKAKPNPAKK